MIAMKCPANLHRMYPPLLPTFLLILLLPRLLPGEPVRTASEWLDEVRNAAETFSPDPVIRTILNGGAIFTHHYYNPTTQDVRGFPLTSEELKDVARFEDFIMSEVGQQLLETVLSQGALHEDLTPYRALAEAVIASTHRRSQRNPANRPIIPLDRDAVAAHFERTEQAGESVLRKGYAGEPLTASDLEALRLYAVSKEVAAFGNYFLPFTLDLALVQPQHEYESRPLQPGDPAPDFVVPRAEAVWESLRFSNRNSYNYLAVFGPHALKEPLLALSGYAPAGEGRVREIPDPATTAFAAENPFDLASQRGERPVLLFLSGPSDSFAWHGKLSNYLTYFTAMYGDRINVVAVATTVHDAHMGSYDYFRPETKGPIKGLLPHAVTWEERAREVKMFYMTKPEIAFEYHLDNLAQHVRNAYHDEGGAGAVFLVNRDGTIGFISDKTTFRERLEQVYTSDALRGQRSQLPPTLFQRANAIEQAIRAALANDGNVPADFEPRLEAVPLVLFGPGEILLMGTISAMDEFGFSMRAELPVEKLIGYHLWEEAAQARRDVGTARNQVLTLVERWVEEDSGNPELRFRVAEETVVTAKGEVAPASVLQAGDRVGVLFGAPQAMQRAQPLAWQIRTADSMSSKTSSP